jgi:hypothetical protein
VVSRLAEARKQLLQRLPRRGVELTAADDVTGRNGAGNATGIGAVSPLDFDHHQGDGNGGGRRTGRGRFRIGLRVSPGHDDGDGHKQSKDGRLDSVGRDLAGRCQRLDLSKFGRELAPSIGTVRGAASSSGGRQTKLANYTLSRPSELSFRRGRLRFERERKPVDAVIQAKPGECRDLGTIMLKPAL